jgi:hypothetical protein
VLRRDCARDSLAGALDALDDGPVGGLKGLEPREGDGPVDGDGAVERGPVGMPLGFGPDGWAVETEEGPGLACRDGMPPQPPRPPRPPMLPPPRGEGM